jgi:hypothetical protein
MEVSIKKSICCALEIQANSPNFARSVFATARKISGNVTRVSRTTPGVLHEKSIFRVLRAKFSADRHESSRKKPHCRRILRRQIQNPRAKLNGR